MAYIDRPPIELNRQIKPEPLKGPGELAPIEQPFETSPTPPATLNDKLLLELGEEEKLAPHLALFEEDNEPSSLDQALATLNLSLDKVEANIDNLNKATQQTEKKINDFASQLDMMT